MRKFLILNNYDELLMQATAGNLTDKEVKKLFDIAEKIETLKKIMKNTLFQKHKENGDKSFKVQYPSFSCYEIKRGIGYDKPDEIVGALTLMGYDRDDLMTKPALISSAKLKKEINEADFNKIVEPKIKYSTTYGLRLKKTDNDKA